MNGEKTFLWRELWCGEKALIEVEEARHNINLPSNTEVVDLIEGGDGIHDT